MPTDEWLALRGITRKQYEKAVPPITPEMDALIKQFTENEQLKIITIDTFTSQTARDLLAAKINGEWTE